MRRITAVSIVAAALAGSAALAVILRSSPGKNITPLPTASSTVLGEDTSRFSGRFAVGPGQSFGSYGNAIYLDVLRKLWHVDERRAAAVPLPGLAGRGRDWVVGPEGVWTSGGTNLTLIDPKTGAQTTVAESRYGRLAYGGGSLWLSATDRVVKFDPVTRSAVREYPLKAGIVQLVWSDGFLYAALGREGVVMKLDPATGTWSRIVTAVPGATNMAITVGSGALWLAFTGFETQQELWRIDLSTGERTISQIPSPTAILAAEGFVWVQTQDAILKIDPVTLEILRSHRLPFIEAMAVVNRSIFAVTITPAVREKPLGKRIVTLHRFAA